MQHRVTGKFSHLSAPILRVCGSIPALKASRWRCALALRARNWNSIPPFVESLPNILLISRWWERLMIRFSCYCLDEHQSKEILTRHQCFQRTLVLIAAFSRIGIQSYVKVLGIFSVEHCFFLDLSTSSDAAKLPFNWGDVWVRTEVPRHFCWLTLILRTKRLWGARECACIPMRAMKCVNQETIGIECNILAVFASSSRTANLIDISLDAGCKLEFDSTSRSIWAKTLLNFWEKLICAWNKYVCRDTR